MGSVKNKTRLVSALISVILTIGLMPAAAFATSERVDVIDLSSYQAVLDKLNEEYGTDWQFYGEIVVTRTDAAALVEFEAEMRVYSQEVMEWHLEAEAAVIDDLSIEVIPASENDFLDEDGGSSRGSGTVLVSMPYSESAAVSGTNSGSGSSKVWTDITFKYYYSHDINTCYQTFQPTSPTLAEKTAGGIGSTSVTFKWKGLFLTWSFVLGGFLYTSAERPGTFYASGF
ncbi:MAG: hypothetical protein FWD45_07090 [Coriobacteriia bacterium]|nr:hypothetical protein [Coriobacteriia bacterium]